MLLRPLWGHAEPHVHQAEAWVDQRVGSYAPWQIAAGSIMATLVLLWVWRFITAFWADVREKGGRAALSSQKYCSDPHTLQYSACCMQTLGLQSVDAWIDFQRPSHLNLPPAGVLQTIFDFLKSLPIIRGIVKKEMDKLIVRRCTRLVLAGCLICYQQSAISS